VIANDLRLPARRVASATPKSIASGRVDAARFPERFASRRQIELERSPRKAAFFDGRPSSWPSRAFYAGSNRRGVYVS